MGQISFDPRSRSRKRCLRESLVDFRECHFRFPQGTRAFLEALSLAECSHSHALVAQTCLDFEILHKARRQWTEAAEWFRKAEAMYERIGDEHQLGRVRKELEALPKGR
jgi:hypothetical protein